MHRNKSIHLIPTEMNNETKIEKKQIELLCDTTQKLIQICNKKELKVSDLKWQPHYSTVFKQLKSQLELILNTDSTKTLDNLNNIPYLLQLKNNLINLFNNFSKFVQENGALIGTKDNHMRKSFFMKVVHFQFLYFEIQSYFPNGFYSPHNVKISKAPAKKWWERKFGDNIFVDLDVFVSKFKEDFPFINQAEIFSFKNSINFTSTNFTTTFEYDLFTRLYSPWEKIIEVWRLIYSHPAYLHFSTYGDTKDTLSKYLNEPGTYVFRISCKDLGFWTIGYVKPSKEMGQVKVDKSNLIEALVEGNKKNMYLYPNGESSNPDLSSLNEFRKEIIVNNEDLQLYECFDDFKECKICRESEKDLQLESCGHQICQGCYKLLRKYDKKTCPFCNQKILSTTKIVNVKDPSVYVDTGERPESHYMVMSAQSNNNDTVNNVENRLYNNARSNNDSVYSSISDEVNGNEPAPSVPPRKIYDPIWNSKGDAKMPLINYPAMSSNNKNPIHLNQFEEVNTTVKPGSSPIYSDMSLCNQKNNESNDNIFSDDLYCDINEQINSQKQNDIDLNHTEIPKSTQPVNIFNVTMMNDDVYFCPNELVDPEVVNISGNTISDDIYLIPNEIERSVQNSPNENVNNVDDVYYNPNDEMDFPVLSKFKEDLLMKWNEIDVERAFRVAHNDEILAREILIEFVAPK